MIYWKVLGLGFLVSGGAISVILLGIQFATNRARTLGNFTVQTDQLAKLLKLPEEKVTFQWLEEPESKRGISVPSMANPSEPILSGVAEEKAGKTRISLYLSQHYKERLEIDPAGANIFINTHLILAYLVSKYEAEELQAHFKIFCQEDCQLEHWNVVQ